MIRFIIKNIVKDGISGMYNESFSTIDCEVEILEKVLRYGGYGEDSYEIHQLLGVELIEVKKELESNK